MIRYDCLKLLAPGITDQLVVTSLKRPENRMGEPVATSGQPFSRHDGYRARRRHRIGHWSAAAESDRFGIGRQHVAVALQSADPGQFGSQNLQVFVFDNQVYSGTRISEPTATAGKTDLAMMARGAGIEHAVTVASLPEFQAEMEAGLNGEGLKFVVCKVEESVRHREILRTDLDPLENKYQFVRYLERTEGRAIFRGRG